MKISLYTADECERVASLAQLRYVSKNIPGIYRRRYGRGYVYYDSKKNVITDKHTLERIKQLVIPAAYKEVWICPYVNGHIQAIGLDDKNRKQYIYHPLWKEIRQQQKFNTLIEFGQCLPKIRKHVYHQLKKPLVLNKTQVICAIIYLLDTACIRIGTSRYAKENHSYGLTTLRKKHLSITKKKAILKFSGKNAHAWHVILQDKYLIKLLKKCEEIPGYELFKYYQEDGSLTVITSQDVNAYLHELTQHAFTAKNFRTWIACREIFYRLTRTECRNKFTSIVKEVAMLLGHTPNVCRKNYIDPDIVLCWESGQLMSWMKNNKPSLRNKDKLFLLWLENK